MSKISKSKRQAMYCMFARGESCERVAEAMNMSLHSVKYQYLRYHDFPLGRKLRMTLLPESVADRAHRLADDLKDIERVDALLATADDKALMSLLDIKRKIKERMAKDLSSSPDATPNDVDPELDAQIAEGYEKVFGTKPPC